MWKAQYKDSKNNWISIYSGEHKEYCNYIVWAVGQHYGDVEYRVIRETEDECHARLQQNQIDQ